jgi:hypothetical protein
LKNPRREKIRNNPFFATYHISRDALLHNFRTGEILPPARTNDQEIKESKEVRDAFLHFCILLISLSPSQTDAVGRAFPLKRGQA